MKLLDKNIYKLFLYCKSEIFEMQDKDKINEYKMFIKELKEQVEVLNTEDFTKDEKLTLDKIKVYLEFADKDVIPNLEKSKIYRWRDKHGVC